MRATLSADVAWIGRVEGSDDQTGFATSIISEPSSGAA